jgi:signal transduction histidine kinase
MALSRTNSTANSLRWAIEEIVFTHSDLKWATCFQFSEYALKAGRRYGIRPSARMKVRSITMELGLAAASISARTGKSKRFSLKKSATWRRSGSRDGGDPNRLWSTAIIVCAWLLVVVAWTPPTYLTQVGPRARLSVQSVFLSVFLGFVPWMMMTPVIFGLARRFPISEKLAVRNLFLQFGAGVLLLPLPTTGGMLLAMVFGPGQPLFYPNMLSWMAITTLYSVPTYIAVAGIGQALAYFQRYRTRERQLARAELKALEAQLNPHFLFNTLNAISALGYRDPSLADRALTQLSELLRLALEERPQELRLRDEIGFVQSYLDLYAIIMPGQVSVEWSVEPSAWDAAVPTMLLQPLVENAIVHGIGKLRSGGNLSFEASRVDDHLRVVVRNDIPKDRPTRPGSGIGLANLRERLRVLYAGAAQLELECVREQAIVVVKFPYRESAR